MRVKLKVGYLYRKIYYEQGLRVSEELLEVIGKTDLEYPMRVKYPEGDCYNWPETVNANEIIEIGKTEDYPEYFI